jgi:hypothetical protein
VSTPDPAHRPGPRARLRPEVGVDDTGFDDRAPCLCVDLDDPIHAREIEHQGFVTGRNRPGQVRRGAPRDDSHAVLGCIAEQCHDLVARRRSSDYCWDAALCDEVCSRQDASRLVGQNRIRPDQRAQI